MTKYQRLVKELNQAEARLEELNQKQVEGQAVMKAAETKLSAIGEDIKASLLRGEDPQKALQEKQRIEGEINTNTALLGALAAALPEQQTRVEETRAAVNAEFARLGAEWLRRGVEIYEQHLTGLLDSLKRLLAAGTLLREARADSTYAETLGEAYRFLPHTRLFRIRSFERNGKGEAWVDFGYSGRMIEEVRGEIEKG